MSIRREKVHQFWNERAQYGINAGTNDFMLKELEERVLCQQIPQGAHVLDIGCGNGSTLIRLAMENQCTRLGLDYAESLLNLAKEELRNHNLVDRLEFRQGNVLNLGEETGSFEHIITQRCLINLDNKEQQKTAFDQIIQRLKPGGFYYMIEAFNDGNRELNILREKFGLEPMTSPWHNLFFELKDVVRWQKDFPVELIKLSHFASTYYYLSRVVYAKLASDKGEELRYDSDINRLSLELPPLGEFGATKLIVWKRNR